MNRAHAAHAAIEDAKKSDEEREDLSAMEEALFGAGESPDKEDDSLTVLNVRLADQDRLMLKSGEKRTTTASGSAASSLPVFKRLRDGSTEPEANELE